MTTWGKAILLFFLLLLAAETRAEDRAFFEQNYVNAGIVRPGTSRISPEVVAPEHPADQMLQTEAKPEPRDKQLNPSASPLTVRPKSYAGRFVSRQSGTESRHVPYSLDETGADN